MPRTRISSPPSLLAPRRTPGFTTAFARVIGVLALSLCTTTAGRAQTVDAAASEPRPSRSRATGDWGAVRPALEARGLVIDGAHTFDWSTAWARTDRRVTAGRGLFDLRATVDLSRWSLPASGTLSVQLLAKRGGDGTLVGQDLQGFSNIDAESFTRLGELWFEQQLAGDRVRVKVGQMDANSEFAATAHSGDYLNSSMGYSPTILLPTYPQPTPGAALFVRPTAHLELSVGAFRGAHRDSAPDHLLSSGPFVIAEAGWRRGAADAPNRVGVGAWRHTGRFERPDGADANGTGGVYLVADQWLRRTADAGRGSVKGFLKAGVADGAIAPFDRHVGAGAEWLGPLAARADDALGVGATWVRGRAEDGGAQREIAFGPFYRIQATAWIAITPDLQIIRIASSPSGPTTRVALTCRARVSF